MQSIDIEEPAVEKPRKKNTAAGVAFLVALLAGGAGGAWWWMQESATPPPPPLKQTPKKTPVRAVAPVSQKAGAPTAPPAASPTPEKAPLVPSAETLGDLTALRGEVEKLKLEVQKEELLAKKKSIREPAPVQAAPLVPPPLSLPELVPPAQAPTMPAVLARKRSSGPVVISVQGVDGDVSALVRTGSRTVTLHRGDRFGGGVVTDITRKAVVIRRGAETAVLPFE